MDFIDYYKILGINKMARQLENNAAYGKLARKHQHDRSPSDKDATRNSPHDNESNEELSDAGWEGGEVVGEGELGEMEGRLGSFSNRCLEGEHWAAGGTAGENSGGRISRPSCSLV